MRPVILALPKGRILDEAAAVFARAGYDLSPVLGDSRRLVHECGALRVLDIALNVTLHVFAFLQVTQECLNGLPEELAAALSPLTPFFLHRGENRGGKLIATFTALGMMSSPTVFIPKYGGEILPCQFARPAIKPSPP